MEYPPQKRDNFKGLLLAEGHAVGALVYSGIGFMGTHQNTVKRTVVLAAAVMGTLADSAFNGFVRMTIHSNSSFFEFSVSISGIPGFILENNGKAND